MADTHVIVLPGGGYAEHAPHEAEPVARWLAGTGVNARVFRYPLNVRHPVPLLALRAEISRLRAEGADRIGLMGFSAGGHLAGLAALAPGAAARETVQFARYAAAQPSTARAHAALKRRRILAPGRRASARGRPR